MKKFMLELLTIAVCLVLFIIIEFTVPNYAYPLQILTMLCGGGFYFLVRNRQTPMV
jgi:hypothetical protein